MFGGPIPTTAQNQYNKVPENLKNMSEQDKLVFSAFLPLKYYGGIVFTVLTKYSGEIVFTVLKYIFWCITNFTWVSHNKSME